MKLIRKLSALFRRRRLEAEMAEEMRQHLERRTQEKIADGLPPDEARYAAQREFGGIAQVQEQCRDERRFVWLEQAVQDVRYAGRQLRRAPGFCLTVVVILALGIGANTAIFSVVNAVLLRPLPYHEPERLVRLYESYKDPGWERVLVAPASFLGWRDQSTVFDGLAAVQSGSFNLSGRGEPERLPGLRASASLFPMLGVQPVLGRIFTPEEDLFGKHHVALISHQLWQRRFAGHPGVLGQSVILNGETCTIVGVMPPAFRFLSDQMDVWTPIAFPPDQINSRGTHSWIAVGRLKPGVTLAQAQAEMNTIAARLAEHHRDQSGRGVALVSLKEEMVGGSRALLLVLLGAVGFVLLIAGVNVANLCLARAAARQNEFAIRAALGAARRRLVRQVLTESLMLALAGGALGAVGAFWTIRLLTHWAARSLPRMEEVQIDFRVLGFTLFISLVTGVAFGLIPALRSRRADLNETLKDARTGGRGRTGLQGFLIVAEMAASLVLLAGAGLVIRSFVRLSEVNPGFNPTHVLSATINLPDLKYPRESDKATFFARLLERVQSLPGVESAAAIYGLPLSGGQSRMSLGVAGRAPKSGEADSAGYRQISPDYFRTMGTALLQGRDFDLRDTKTSKSVVIVNETFARQFFRDESPIGKRLHIGSGDHGPWTEVVGVVRDVRHENLAVAPIAEMYVPFGQKCWGHGAVVVRTKMDPTAVARVVRQATWDIDPEQPVYAVRTMETVVSEALAGRRVQVVVLGAFAAIAVTLAAVGIYGVLAYVVAQRTREIGLRMALGARKSDVLRLIIGRGMKLALAGLGAGLVGALALTRVMSSLLYEVKPTDSVTFTAATLLLTLIALLACWLPARRATKVDPMVALRSE